MTPDQRMRQALADLQAQLEDGVQPEIALAEAAEFYGFKKDVLAKRAEPLGPLEAVGPKAADRMRRARKEAEARVAVRDFCFLSTDESFEQWMNDKVGRLPTDDEHWQAFDIVSRHLVSEMLKSEKIKSA